MLCMLLCEGPPGILITWERRAWVQVAGAEAATRLHKPGLGMEHSVTLTDFNQQRCVTQHVDACSCASCKLENFHRIIFNQKKSATGCAAHPGARVTALWVQCPAMLQNLTV